MIEIREYPLLESVITVVLDGKKIKDIRVGERTEHSERAAKYHAKRIQQGTIPAYNLAGSIVHLSTES